MLALDHCNLSDVAHVNLHVSQEAMAAFDSINHVYRSFFGSSPPSRACVATVLPDGVNVKLEVFACKEPDSRAARKALHVQSLSYWAAANIGPYSQAVNVS